MKLNEIAYVKTGLVLCRKQSKIKENIFKYQQLNFKSVEDEGNININDTIPYYASEKLSGNYLTHMNDVIVKTSEPYTAVHITEDYTGLVVPSHFVIIRVDENKAISQYIAWYLNRECVKQYLKKNCSGTLMQIKPTVIAEIEIKLPPLEKQCQIVELLNTAIKEIKLYERLVQKKQVYYKAMINKLSKM